jgi:hypothetical protein
MLGKRESSEKRPPTLHRDRGLHAAHQADRTISQSEPPPHRLPKTRLSIHDCFAATAVASHPTTRAAAEGIPANLE